MKKSFRAWSAKHSFKELVSVENCRVTVLFYHLPCKELLFYFLKTYFEFTHVNTEEDICRSPWTTASCYCVWTITGCSCEQLHWRKERLWTLLRAAGSRETFYFFRVLNSYKIFWNLQPSSSKCIYLLTYSFIWISWLVPLLNILEKRKKKWFKAATETVIQWTVVPLFTFNILQHSNFKIDKY